MTKLINLDSFASHIKSALGQTAGYSYYIKDLSRPQEPARRGKGGYAVRPHDSSVLLENPNSPNAEKLFNEGQLMTWTTPMEIMSMSKTITAAAAVQLITRPRGKTEPRAADLADGLDSPIAPFLPGDWELSDNIKLVTFRHLLTHKTYFHEFNSEDGFLPHPKFNPPTGRATAYYSHMKKSIERGIDSPPSDSSERYYQNMNYGLFRILIPYILRRNSLEAHRKTMSLKGQPFFELVLGATYFDYVKRQILAPAGLNNVGLASPHSDSVSAT